MSTSMNDKLDLIFGRRSIRVYGPGAVSEATVTKLLEAAMAAPSAMTKDPWRFVIVRNKETLTNLAALHPGAAMLSTVPVALNSVRSNMSPKRAWPVFCNAQVSECNR